MITLEFDHFHVASPNAEFKHFLESSKTSNVTVANNASKLRATGGSKGQPAGIGSNQAPPSDQQIDAEKLQQSFFMRFIMSIALHFVGMVEMKMTNLSFDMQLPVHACAIQGSADKMHILGKRSQLLGTEGFTVVNVIHGGIMEILDGGEPVKSGQTPREKERAMMYVGHGARFAIDFVAANGHMDVMANLYGREDDLEVRIQPFLSFYHKYQQAEDNALELKLAKGLPTASKMSMGVEFEYMKVGLYDQRIENSLLVIEVERVSACLMTYRMTLDGKRTHKNKLCLDENVEASSAPTSG
jgi:hypothetical protein